LCFTGCKDKNIFFAKKVKIPDSYLVVTGKDVLMCTSARMYLLAYPAKVGVHLKKLSQEIEMSLKVWSRRFNMGQKWYKSIGRHLIFELKGNLLFKLQRLISAASAKICDLLIYMGSLYRELMAKSPFIFMADKFPAGNRLCNL
jgi:hypothetical protein